MSLCLLRNFLFLLCCCYWHFKHQKKVYIEIVVWWLHVHLLVGRLYPFYQNYFKSEKQHSVVVNKNVDSGIRPSYLTSTASVTSSKKKMQIHNRNYLIRWLWRINDVIHVECLLSTNLNNLIKKNNFHHCYLTVVSHNRDFTSNCSVFQTTESFLFVLNWHFLPF